MLIRRQVPSLPPSRYLASVVAIGLALCSAGCASSGKGLGGLRETAETPPTPAARPEGEPRPLWWQTVGDPALATLIDGGLAANPEIVCDAVSLQAKELQAEAAANRLGGRIQRLFDTGAKSADEAASQARAYRHADRRARVAADIAAAYLEVRRLQETYALRAKLLDQFKDDAEIAGFRREAGLVTGVDSGLAGSLVSVTASDLDASRDQIEAAMRELARLTGMELAAVRTALGDEGRVPDIAADVSGQTRLSLARRADLLALESSLVADMTRQKVTQEDLDAVLAGKAADKSANSPAAIAVAKYREAQATAYDDLKRLREAVAAASARQTELDASNRGARATVRDARLAYRSGTANFTTLYVAEAAELAVNEARIRARTALATATIRLWTAEGGGWTMADLAAPSTPAGVRPEVTVCE